LHSTQSQASIPGAGRKGPTIDRNRTHRRHGNTLLSAMQIARQAISPLCSVEFEVLEVERPVLGGFDHLIDGEYDGKLVERIAAAAVVADCCPKTGDAVVFGFVASVQGAENECCFVIEVASLGDLGVDRLDCLDDRDVDGDHVGWNAGM
jgi:hypothetical protein